MWLSFGQMVYDYDENFLKISNYAKEHDIKNIDKDNINKKR